MSTYRQYQKHVITRPNGDTEQHAELIDDDEYEPAARGVTIATRVIYAISGVIIALLALRFVLSMLGANRGNAFADFIYTASHPFVAPFFGLFNYRVQYGVARFEVETLIATAVYAIVAALIVTILTIPSRKNTV